MPRARGVLIFKMARPHILQRFVAVEGVASRNVDAQPGRVVTDGVRQRDTHAADTFHDPLERAEVDLDEVIDREAEFLKYRVDQQLRVVAAVGPVDPLSAVTGDLDPQVAGERENG